MITTENTDAFIGATPVKIDSNTIAFNVVMPWLAGSAIAAGQAFLATGCSVPKVGKCVGCGSCIVAVASLSAWAIRHRRQNRLRLFEQGLEPFEVQTKL